MAVTDQPRRIPGLGAIIAIALLILPIVAVTWWLNRSKGDNAAQVSLADIDVVCLGRVDGRKPVVHLEPTTPGTVFELFVTEGDTVKANQQLLKLNDESLTLRVEEA